MTFNEYMESIDPLHKKALQAVASLKGILFIITELVPDDVRDDMLKKIKEANHG